MNKRIEQFIPVMESRPDLARDPGGCSQGTNFIQLSVNYDPGGINGFSGRTNTRGYYIHATPVERVERDGVRMLGRMLGSGVRECVLAVSRQSDKQLGIACAIAAEKAKLHLEWCRREYGLCYSEPEEYFPGARKISVPGKSA